MKNEKIYYAPICDQMIMGAFRTRKEALEADKKWQTMLCPIKHKVQKCRIVLLKSK